MAAASASASASSATSPNRFCQMLDWTLDAVDFDCTENITTVGKFVKQKVYAAAAAAAAAPFLFYIHFPNHAFAVFIVRIF